ncbi:MAG: trypsin-like peptidase domain-containing protein [Planctomycetota bacterium]
METKDIAPGTIDPASEGAAADAEAASAAGPAGDGAAGPPMFDKPNLQMRDPDPYAFANRIRRLTIIACVMASLAIAPFVSRIVAYQIRRGQMQAEVEVATGALAEVAPTIEGFAAVSRLVSQKVGPSVVSIFPRTGIRRGAPGGQGSGFLVDAEGFVITNYHVVENATQLTVQFANGETSDASVIGADPETDLALLRVDPVDLPAAAWGDSDSLEQGDVVWAVGSPFGLQSSVTFGIVSAKSRRAESGATGSIYQEFLQTDAAVNPGNSGGPLVNLAGEVIGVNTAIMGQSYRGVSFAIPSTLARDKYEVLRDRKYIERGFLGIEPRLPPEVLRRKFGLEVGEGVLVFNRRKDSPAEFAGLERGDVILRWNEHEASDPTLLSRAIAATQIGSKATVVVRRLEGGKPIDRELTVQVGRKPDVEPR